MIRTRLTHRAEKTSVKVRLFRRPDFELTQVPARELDVGPQANPLTTGIDVKSQKSDILSIADHPAWSLPGDHVH
jgi:hypothetical protein